MSSGSEDQDKRDASYVQGSEAAWLAMLGHCMQALGYAHPTVEASKWVLERQAAVNSLRGLCEEFGDTDWPNDLHLQDIIEKHLGNHLRE